MLYLVKRYFLNFFKFLTNINTFYEKENLIFLYGVFGLCHFY